MHEVVTTNQRTLGMLQRVQSRRHAPCAATFEKPSFSLLWRTAPWGEHPVRRRSPSGAVPAGISLLEVVLALALLAMASAYLAQSMGLATSNALRAQQLSKAEIVAESVMNEMIAGLIPAQATTWTQYQTVNGQNNWMYQVQQVQAEVEGMIGLQVAVQEVDPTQGLDPSKFDLYINRWIIDPSLGLDTPPETEEETTADTGETSTGGQASGGQAAGGQVTGGQVTGGQTGAAR